MDKNSKICIFGKYGMVGSAIYRQLIDNGFTNIISKRHAELDLTQQSVVNDYLTQQQPEYVILAAAKVGGIYANNKYRGQFIYENLMIQSNIIHASYINNVKKLIFLGSSCIYPKLSKQPIKEESLLTSPLEPTNEPYAIAKIAGLRMCQAYNEQYNTNFISLMPTNLYGIGDNYDPENSQVIPGLIQKLHNAKENNLPSVSVWGDGTQLREFLCVDDLAKACVFILESINYKDIVFEDINMVYSHINVGSGKEISIKRLSEIIKDITGFKGKLFFDKTKPNGTPRKIIDSSRLLKLGWKPKIDFLDGLKTTYTDFLTKR